MSVLDTQSFILCTSIASSPKKPRTSQASLFPFYRQGVNEKRGYNNFLTYVLKVGEKWTKKILTLWLLLVLCYYHKTFLNPAPHANKQTDGMPLFSLHATGHLGFRGSVPTSEGIWSAAFLGHSSVPHNTFLNGSVGVECALIKYATDANLRHRSTRSTIWS